MAATASAWSKPGAWALDSEEHEAELLQQSKDNLHHSAAGAAADSDFPSLAAAAATTKTKKKKAVTLSLQEFSSIDHHSKPSVYTPSRGSARDDLPMDLPTGPRQWTPEELDRSKGFRSYGSNSFDRSSRVSNSDEPRRQGGGGGFGRDSGRDFAPSRADETDDWGASKKSSLGGGFERRDSRDRRVFFPDSQSRADESDSWVSNKTFVPSEGRRFDRRRGFESNGGVADSDNWSRKKEEDGRRIGGAFDSLRERRGSHGDGRGGTDSDGWGKKEEGGVRPRLNLQPRTLPVGEEQSDVTVKPKGSNPFGDARPREEVLKEKGKDWKEIDEKLESLKVKDVGGSIDRPSFGKRGFANGHGRDSSSERSWRKLDVADARPQSAEKSENEVAQEAEDKESQA